MFTTTDSPRARQRPADLVDRQKLSVEQQQRLEQFAFEHASVPESYDIAISDGQLLQTSCGQGMASVLEDGKFWHIAGGLLSSKAYKPQMIEWLAELSQCTKKTLAVYNVCHSDAVLLGDAGFVVNKFGEEPILDLADLTWTGKPYEWVRRQSNFCNRADIDISEITSVQQQQDLAEVLLEIMNDDLAGRTFDQPLRLLEGQFDAKLLKRRRLFVARRSDSTVEGFLACSPLEGGRGWAFETYRKRSDATRGVTAHLFKTVTDLLRAEGVAYVSLCLVPGRNVADSSIPNGDWRLNKSLSFLYSHMGSVFNAQGQDHFKSRFRPRYEERYLCVNPGSSVRSLWSFLRTTGALKANLGNLTRQTLGLRKRKPK